AFLRTGRADAQVVAVGRRGHVGIPGPAAKDDVLGVAKRRLGGLEGQAAVTQVGAHALLHGAAAEDGDTEQRHGDEQHHHDDQRNAGLAPRAGRACKAMLLHSVRPLRLTTFDAVRVRACPSMSSPVSVMSIRTATTSYQLPGAATYWFAPSRR